MTMRRPGAGLDSRRQTEPPEPRFLHAAGAAGPFHKPSLPRRSTRPGNMALRAAPAATSERNARQYLPGNTGPARHLCPATARQKRLIDSQSIRQGAKQRAGPYTDNGRPEPIGLDGEDLWALERVWIAENV